MDIWTIVIGLGKIIIGLEIIVMVIIISLGVNSGDISREEEEYDELEN
jgi:hypothetical protein